MTLRRRSAKGGRARAMVFVRVCVHTCVWPILHGSTNSNWAGALTLVHRVRSASSPMLSLFLPLPFSIFAEYPLPAMWIYLPRAEGGGRLDVIARARAQGAACPARAWRNRRRGANQSGRPAQPAPGTMGNAVMVKDRCTDRPEKVFASVWSYFGGLVYREKRGFNFCY